MRYVVLNGGDPGSDLGITAGTEVNLMSSKAHGSMDMIVEGREIMVLDGVSLEFQAEKLSVSGFLRTTGSCAVAVHFDLILPRA